MDEHPATPARGALGDVRQDGVEEFAGSVVHVRGRAEIHEHGVFRRAGQGVQHGLDQGPDAVHGEGAVNTDEGTGVLRSRADQQVIWEPWAGLLEGVGGVLFDVRPV